MDLEGVKTDRATDRLDAGSEVIGAEIHRHRDDRQAATGKDFKPGSVGEDDELLAAAPQRRRGAMAVDDDLLRL